MDARAFLAEFGHIASAPSGVDEVRRLAMGLALSGDLSKGNEDLPSNFYSQLQAAKEKYFHELGRRVTPFLFREALLKEFKIPDGWRWVRVGEVCDLQTGATPSTRRPEFFGGDIRWLVSGDINRGRILDCDGRITDAGLRNSNCKILPAGSVLIALNGQGKTRATVALLCIPAACNQSLVAMIPFDQEILHPNYLLLALKFRYREIREITGEKQRRGLNMRLVSELSLPLPPLAEQKRIVAKVNELMALCDKLEAQQEVRETLAKTTRDSVFGKLAAARTHDEVHQAWGRVETEAQLLLDCPESISSYRAAILDLAVSGLLLGPNDQANKTGTNLLEEIAGRRMDWMGKAQDQELKEALGMQKKLRTQHVEKPKAGLPANWAWGSLLQISQLVVDCHNKTAPYVPQGIHLVRTSDIRNGQMDLRNTRKISADTYAYWARRLPPRAGDVFFTREAPMGEAAIVPEGETVCLGQRSMLIRLFPELFNNRFLLYVIYSPSFQARMMEAAIGITVKHLRVGGVEDLMVPVPPKQEQDRIVAIVDALFVHCDRLMAQLASKQATASNLAKASVETITGIRTEVHEEMKAPKTELVSRLRLGVSPADKDQAPLVALLMRSKGELAAKALWQSSGLEIDAFYRQLKTEMAHGWIVQPEVAYVREMAAG